VSLIFADNPYHPFSFNYFAFGANLFGRRSDFHYRTPDL
jgi:hypothetical protein